MGMKMSTIRSIRADMRNKVCDLPDWVVNTSYRDYYRPDWDSYVSYWGW